MQAEASQELDQVDGEGAGDQRRGHVVVEEQVQRDQQRGILAQGEGGVEVHAAGEGPARGQLRVAKRIEHRDGTREHVRDDDAGPRADGRHAGQHEDACADRRSHAHQAQLDHTQRTLQVMEVRRVVAGSDAPQVVRG